MLARPSPGARPAVATLDDELWERVGRLLVARGRVGPRDLDAAVAEQRRTCRPLDEILVEQGVPRPAVASAVLVVQLGDELREHLRRSEPGAVPGHRAQGSLQTVPAEPRRAFALACLGVDVVLVTVACLLAALARTGSSVPLPPAGWIALFAALAVGLYWAWRLGTFATSLRPWADVLLLAGSTSLAGLLVLTIRSLDGTSGVAETLLPLWAFTTVYGVAGRTAFYLAWPVRSQRSFVDPSAEPVPAEPEEPEQEESRMLGVVPIRPELWSLLDELRLEVDEILREQRAGSGLAKAG